MVCSRVPFSLQDRVLSVRKPALYTQPASWAWPRHALVRPQGCLTDTGAPRPGPRWGDWARSSLMPTRGGLLKWTAATAIGEVRRGGLGILGEYDVLAMAYQARLMGMGQHSGYAPTTRAQEQDNSIVFSACAFAGHSMSLRKAVDASETAEQMHKAEAAVTGDSAHRGFRKRCHDVKSSNRGWLVYVGGAVIQVTCRRGRIRCYEKLPADESRQPAGSPVSTYRFPRGLPTKCRLGSPSVE